MTIRLRHAYGRWQLTVGGDREQEITAEEALGWAAHAGETHAEMVQDMIREHADKAEERAKEARKRAKDEVVRQAEAALAAESYARFRRAEANQLAPVAEASDGCR